MTYVNLYTKQHIHSLHELERRGEVTNKAIYIQLHMGDIGPWFLKRYSHFVRLAEQRVPKPDCIEYPIWCSVSQGNCLKPDKNSVVYCLSVPIEEVIYFDSYKWDRVLNNLYIPLDDQDYQTYLADLKKLGIADEFNFIDGKYARQYPAIERKIIDSWDRIFMIDRWNEFTVQANLWQIKEEWVRHVVHDGEDLFEIAQDMEESFPPDLAQIPYFKA